ncbi:MAG: type II toxin-antitoxin system VapC family toxin [Verrucomicrobiaceae bacterium]|nr:type II toxin-antitoxin system VapC family toxin [Verrucomicrobiaceae bacterium]
MKYLIDTMVLSEPTKRKQDANVIHWFSLHRHECAVSVLTLGEVERGITKMKDSNRKHRLMAWFNTITDGMENAGRILPVDRALMSFWGPVYSREERLTRRKPPFVDTLLAATAEMHGLTMVTRNEKDFPKTLALVNPWKV